MSIEPSSATQRTPEVDAPHVALGLEPLLRPVAELREDPANARAHDARNIEAIKTSLRTFGQRKPIVVRGGAVVAGN